MFQRWFHNTRMRMEYKKKKSELQERNAASSVQTKSLTSDNIDADINCAAVDANYHEFVTPVQQPAFPEMNNTASITSTTPSTDKHFEDEEITTSYPELEVPVSQPASLEINNNTVTQATITTSPAFKLPSVNPRLTHPSKAVWPSQLIPIDTIPCSYVVQSGNTRPDSFLSARIKYEQDEVPLPVSVVTLNPHHSSCVYATPAVTTPTSRCYGQSSPIEFVPRKAN